jgi:hypothetical protein
MEDCSCHHSCLPDVLDATLDMPFWLPKRILKWSDGSITLQENLEKPHERPIYACSSHCWGDPKDIITTTLTTLNHFKLEVPWSKLSQTFRNAVDICQRLGINFLWIDSLCMIQDSDEDWKEESAKMADIYKNAFLAIAATASKDSSSGCYTTTDPEFIARSVSGETILVNQQLPAFPTRH